MEQTENNGFEDYRIKPLQKFEVSYKALVKKHYRKNKKALEEFEKLLLNYLDQLEKNPCSKDVSAPEPFPNGIAEQGFDLRKKGGLDYLVYKGLLRRED